jgi:hypothetical protein
VRRGYLVLDPGNEARARRQGHRGDLGGHPVRRVRAGLQDTARLAYQSQCSSLSSICQILPFRDGCSNPSSLSQICFSMTVWWTINRRLCYDNWWFGWPGISDFWGFR